MTVADALKKRGDEELIAIMLGPDEALAELALYEFETRHFDDPAPAEPAHCAECFEGCAKCQPEASRG